MSRACRIPGERRSSRGAAECLAARAVALIALCVVGAGPVAAGDATPEAPDIVRPDAAGMGEGGWTDTSKMAAMNGALDAEGIERELEAQLVAGVPRPRIDLNIEFEFNSAALTPVGRTELDAAGVAMSRHFREKRFILGGHTDASGPADYNLRLSRMRAESARRYLIEAHDIAPERLDAEGYGEARPIESGPPERNRRVVLELVR